MRDLGIPRPCPARFTRRCCGGACSDRHVGVPPLARRGSRHRGPRYRAKEIRRADRRLGRARRARPGEPVRRPHAGELRGVKRAVRGTRTRVASDGRPAPCALLLQRLPIARRFRGARGRGRHDTAPRRPRRCAHHTTVPRCASETSVHLPGRLTCPREAKPPSAAGSSFPTIGGDRGAKPGHGRPVLTASGDDGWTHS
jgi:hypothetical protein